MTKQDFEFNMWLWAISLGFLWQLLLVTFANQSPEALLIANLMTAPTYLIVNWRLRVDMWRWLLMDYVNG